ncbi:uncharacterized protein AMSG_03351 [Thecamonas trahens ATCC 50062]|uniref:RING-type domain-containing protein n=1 Tax=Thecamonas trahens ATCC 50062 TaxID=461836 RepID=A0A0L0D3V5_THETB|nr:hypothetical protein AMSG_03351 [Thecamonas trahens ATCC 50062]KNC46920.1 hypothetical protein AMSG_03351 [Thecamonas trahens ATCC 50062]|eukprot:XP_013760193.1 hypothetical protein AMSG_03351 [Thecamonas trahens ATCC 50062]
MLKTPVAMQALESSPHVAMPWLALRVTLLLAYATAWLAPRPNDGLASIKLTALLMLIKAGVLVVMGTMPEAAFPLGLGGCLLWGWIFWRLRVLDFVFGVYAQVEARGGHVMHIVGALFAVVGHTVRRLLATFHVRDIGFLYSTAVMASDALHRARNTDGSVIDMVLDTLHVAGLSTGLRYHALLCALAVWGGLAIRVVEVMFVPSTVRAVASEGVEFPFLNPRHRAGYIGNALCWTVVMLKPYGLPLLSALSHVPILLFVYGLHMVCMVAEVSSASLMVMASSGETRGQHVRVLALFGCVVVLEVWLVVAFARLYATMSGDTMTYLALYLLNMVVRGLIRLLKSFMLYVIHHLASAARIEAYVFYTELSANCMEIGIKALVLLGNIRQSGREVSADKIFIAMYAYDAYKFTLANWEAYKRRREAVLQFDAQVADATPAQIEAYDDVCAFCWDDMEPGSAKITRCGHVFHSGCLQKWLHVNSACPKCRQSVLETGAPSGE